MTLMMAGAKKEDLLQSLKQRKFARYQDFEWEATDQAYPIVTWKPHDVHPGPRPRPSVYTGRALGRSSVGRE